MPYSTMNPRTLISAKSIIVLAFIWLLVCTPRAFSDDDKIEKIAVMGASASAGFGIVEEIMISEDSVQLQGVSLGDVLIKAAKGQDVVVLDLASGGFFSRPVPFGRASVERANSWNADLVVAIDFLFWFVYGSVDLKDNATSAKTLRLKKLDEGLRQLGELNAPLVVGEVPDMSPAVGRMLRKSQMPDIETIKAVNERIRAWAQERPDVGVLPLFGLINTLRSGEAFQIGKHQWHPSEQGFELILSDRLHPSLAGLVALLQAADATAFRIEGVSGRMPELTLDHEALVERVHRGDMPAAEAADQAASEEPTSAVP